MSPLEKLIWAINLLVREGVTLSILLGLFIAIAGTQYIKRLDCFPSKKWLIRALALPLGFIPTFFTWPVHNFNGIRVFISLAVGLGAPVVYTIIVRVLYWKWPQLEPKLSAQPPTIDPDL